MTPAPGDDSALGLAQRRIGELVDPLQDFTLVRELVHKDLLQLFLQFEPLGDAEGERQHRHDREERVIGEGNGAQAVPVHRVAQSRNPEQPRELADRTEFPIRTIGAGHIMDEQLFQPAALHSTSPACSPTNPSA